MDPADRFTELARLGLDAFLAAAPPAALVRPRPGGASVLEDEISQTVELDVDTLVAPSLGRKKAQSRLELYPLVKKPNAPFPDMITIGRTPNNDVVLRDATVSRLHAFFRHRKDAAGADAWIVADGGSKNGTLLDGERLEARRERPVQPGQIVKIGDLELTFYTAMHLFRVLGGT